MRERLGRGALKRGMLCFPLIVPHIRLPMVVASVSRMVAQGLRCGEEQINCIPSPLRAGCKTRVSGTIPIFRMHTPLPICVGGITEWGQLVRQGFIPATDLARLAVTFRIGYSGAVHRMGCFYAGGRTVANTHAL